MKQFRLILLILSMAMCSTLFAQEQPQTSVSGFVDVYYAYSFLNNPLRDRSFTTQPMRHNEFNLNLAMIDVKHTAATVRGRFAFQTGTYVQANLAAETSLLKNVLEASVGYKASENIWIDAGIFPSHIGFESIFSKDNWNYSRSLLSDFSPFYEAGVSLTAALSDRVTLRGLVMNGWQNIVETNNDKAFGTQLQYKPVEPVLINWSTFIGNEQPDTSVSRLRIFNDFFAQITLSDQWSVAGVLDIGAQKQALGDSYDIWHTASLMVKQTISEQWAIAGRVEYFMDKNGALIPTGTPENFQTTGGSINLDFAPVPNVLWRAEVRLLNSNDAIYPTQTGFERTDGFFVLSAAISF